MGSRDEYVQSIKDAFLTLAKKAAMATIVQKLPFLLQFAFLNNIASFIVGKVLEYAIKEGEVGAFFLYIDMRVGVQSKSFTDAALYNSKAQVNGTPEEKKIAEENLINSFRAFVKFTN